MGKKEIKIGQILFQNTTIGIKERVVSKVATKYFYCDGDSKRPFSKEDLQYRSEYTMHSIQLYLSKQAIIDEVEYGKLGSKIRAYFRQYSPLKLTLEQLRAIDNIISTI